MDIVIIIGNGVGDSLQEKGFTGFRGRDYQAPLTSPDGGDQIDQARG